MKHITPYNNLIRQNFLFILGVCICVYFVYHALQGHRSLPHLLSLQKQIEKNEKELAAVKRNREKIESKVVMLRPGSIQKDFLEERARVVLGYKAQDEMAIIYPDQG